MEAQRSSPTEDVTGDGAEPDAASHRGSSKGTPPPSDAIPGDSDVGRQSKDSAADEGGRVFSSGGQDPPRRKSKRKKQAKAPGDTSARQASEGADGEDEPGRGRLGSGGLQAIAPNPSSSALLPSATTDAPAQLPSPCKEEASANDSNNNHNTSNTNNNTNNDNNNNNNSNNSNSNSKLLQNAVDISVETELAAPAKPANDPPRKQSMQSPLMKNAGEVGGDEKGSLQIQKEPTRKSQKVSFGDDTQAHIIVVEHDGAEKSMAPKGSTGSNGSRNGGTGGRTNIRTSLRKSLEHPKAVRLRTRLAWIIEAQWFKACMMGTLFVALFGTSLFTIFDVPDDPGKPILDTIMTVIMLIYVAELLITSFVRYRHYVFSSFFWMDFLGTISMAFEISYLLGEFGKTKGSSESSGGSVDTVLLRSARAAKVGARVGRLTKTMKCLASIWKSADRSYDEGGDPDDVKVISRKLMLLLSTKVSVLALVLMLISPLFQIAVYPEADFSMKAWAQSLEMHYHQEARALAANQLLAGKADPEWLASDEYQAVFGSVNGTFEETVLAMLEFYSKSQYYPFRTAGFPEKVTTDGVTVEVSGSHLVTGEKPNQEDSIYTWVVNECLIDRRDCTGEEKASVSYDFTAPRQMEAAMDTCLILFMLLVMLLCTFDLSRTLDQMVLVPLTRIMGVVRSSTANILTQVSMVLKNGEDDVSEDGGEASGVSEIQLLELVLAKLAALSKLCMQDNVVDDDELESLTLEGRGVIMDMMQLGNEKRWSLSSIGSEDLPVQHMPTVSDHAHELGSRLSMYTTMLEVWDVNMLQLEAGDLDNMITCIFFRSEVGRRTRHYASLSTIVEFARHAKLKYTDQLYHNWMHAVDVLHFVHRSLMLVQGGLWIAPVKEYALLVSALSHDLGHFGRTNPFLIETRHELALRYNDKSPLENMHCATLFGICMQTSANVFGKMSSGDYSAARKVCIGAILHTDNAHHFEMVKEIAKIYEMTNGTCDNQAAVMELNADYVENVLQKNEQTFLQLFLHSADVSNPLKPFDISKAWAHRVIGEFFDQGDEEKKLGIPVGMLNDRTKVNFPSSQHGFMLFLVSPLIFGLVNIFQPFADLAVEMADNLQCWCDMWEEEDHPPADEVSKRQVQINQARKTAQMLKDREQKFGATESRDAGKRYSLSKRKSAHVSSTED